MEGNSPKSAKSPKTPYSKKGARGGQDGEETTKVKKGGKDKQEQESKKTIDEFQTTPALSQAAQSAWQRFLKSADSQEAAGEALYASLFDAAPSLQSLFTTARAVQAMKFLVGIDEIVMHMDSQEKLPLIIETLGFQHLHLDVTPDRVAIFRDAITTLLTIELGESFTEQEKEGLASILTYSGNALIWIRSNYMGRLKILTESWKIANDKRDEHMKAQAATVDEEAEENEDDDGKSDWESQHNANEIQTHVPDGAPTKKGGLFSRMWGSKKGDKHSGTHNGQHEKHETSHSSSRKKGEQTLPTSFNDMFKINSAVMGLVENDWMDEVLESFDSLVVHVQNSNRIKEECDVLSLRLAKYEEAHGKGTVKLNEFKACMLAALRSSLPKHWSGQHEIAWSWMWDNVARMMSKKSGELVSYEKHLVEWIQSKSEEDLFDIRSQIYATFFNYSPAGQEYFKQSNTRLHFIADRVIQMIAELFAEPRSMVQNVSGLGLRHVEFGIPTDHFGSFVTSCVEVVRTVTDDQLAVEAFRWGLGVIAKILTRTIDEGSTVVMKAINANSLKQLKKAIDGSPRIERAAWLLDIQVGAQSISPLSWAIESGSLDVARAIIKDLLIIRADRANYYYGCSELFRRHPEIVQRLVEDAPMLLPTLLDGLIWRSHRPENGSRRVNYYVKHLFINPEGEFADALKWLAATGDPAIIAHPVGVLVSDTLWNGVVFRQFIFFKMWGILCLLVFMSSQGVLPRMITSDTEEDEVKRIEIAVLALRIFIYVLSMGRLAFFHLARIWVWCRTTFKTIFDEIDQDGSGSIDWDEFKEAIVIFRHRVKEELAKKFAFLRDDDGPATMDDDRKAIASQSKSLNNTISFICMLILGLMCTHEPMIHCFGHENWPTSDCSDAKGLQYRYSILSMSALVIHWLILVDLAVFSTEISAFLLVCGHVMSEVRQFLSALSFLLLLFGSSIPIFCSNCPLVAGNYSSMPRAIVSLFAITLGWFEADPVMEVRDTDQVFLFTLFAFVGIAVILLLNLLIAQLNRSYEYIYQDMLGFARLNRASLIVDAMLGTSKTKWISFRDGLGFENKLEFDHGDLGLAGGLQCYEAQNLHVVTEEAIRRFGGSTDGSVPWPEEKVDTDDTDDRFDRMEVMFKKAIRRMTQNMSKKRTGGGSGGGSGSGGGGSGSDESDVSSTGED